MSAASTTVLTGWGRTAPSAAALLTPRAYDELRAVLLERPRRGVIARGLGRSYGDPAQNAGGVVVDMTRLDRVVDIDLARGVVTCEAGVSLHRLMEMVLPFGWFVPVTPGTRQVTVGGAIGADVHGKNHHADGSFAQHVTSLDLLTADGGVRTVGPDHDPELFWATAGGMGLTGIVLRATLTLTPVTTSMMGVTAQRLENIDAVMERMSEIDTRYRYTVAWLDCLASGRGLGRGIVETGQHVGVHELPARLRREPLAFKPLTLATAPATVPSGLLNRASIALFNEVWYRKAPRRRKGTLKSIGAFFHPLDGVRSWNRMYGPDGFLQYQFVVPFGAENTLRRVVELISRAGAPSFLTVLKRFGPGNPGMLSFPMPGWTLALDFPAGTPGLARLLARLDEMVLAAGGRLYLAKDSRMPAELLSQMYPRLEQFRRVRSQVDPDGVFISDLARRLSL